jgi:hypothetical protein
MHLFTRKNAKKFRADIGAKCKSTPRAPAASENPATETRHDVPHRMARNRPAEPFPLKKIGKIQMESDNYRGIAGSRRAANSLQF